ncbi:LysR family transcriptional regulator [Bordetella genomosp. 13]|uniref:LysR family transcriptional regulator n=1 Tax=Bordetella genomosp. 13 TaxID=463040 RepID=UPI0011A5EEA5|nr:LysR family transcriptional regulator [Bordetella genomosp. 13]
MNLSWLEDFLALAATGSFSRAAEARHMTQPAFSRRIRALEDWLGVVLVDRGTHPATLTETGAWFRNVAREILARVERVPDEARAVDAATSATLRFAATHALSLHFLPQWLRSLESRTPVGPIQLASDVLQQCEGWMQNGRVQFLLSHAHADAPGRLPPQDYPSVQVGADVLMPVCVPGRAGRARWNLAAGKRGGPVPILAYSAESGLGRLVRTLCADALDLAGGKPVFTAHLATVLKSMALDGRGVAWLPRSLIEDELDQGRLVPAGPEGTWIPLEIRLYRRAAPDTATAEAFWAAAGGPA